MGAVERDGLTPAPCNRLETLPGQFKSKKDTWERVNSHNHCSSTEWGRSLMWWSYQGWWSSRQRTDWSL